MIRAKEARQEAREALSGKWKKAILISLIYTLITAGISFLSVFTFGLLSIALIVIAPALSYGLAYSYYHLKNGEDVGYGDFLSIGFKNFDYSWKLTWNIIKKCWVYILIFVLAIIIIMVSSVALTVGTVGSILSSANDKTYYSASYDYADKFDYYYDGNIDYESYYDSLEDLYDDYYENYSEYNDYDSLYSKNSAPALVGAIVGVSAAFIGIAVLIFIGYLVFIIFFIRKIMLYALTFYIAVKKEGIEAKDAVLESERLMNGNRGRFFCLILSFIGWSILIGFVSALLNLIPFLGTIASYVGTIILTPYITFSILAFYRDLDEEKNAYVNSNINSNENIQTNANVVNSASEINNTNNSDEIKNDIENITVNIEKVATNSGKKFCKRCGAENTSDATYCTSCGAKLD